MRRTRVITKREVRGRFLDIKDDLTKLGNWNINNINKNPVFRPGAYKT